MKTENGAATEYVYNSLNQLVSDSETAYEYDFNGNLVRVIGTAHSALYEYNAENKLVKATVQSGNLVIEESYTYDYQGNRTSKTTHRSDGVTEYVKYLNDNSSLTNVLAELDKNGTAKCVYTIGADLVSQERNGKVSVYLYDGHGSVVGLANENGVVTDTYSYDAFGNLLRSTGSTANNYRYCGEQFDETTGLYYLRARYMDTSTGRFISQDSFAGTINDPVSLHKYLYANANPVMYTDPSGYASFADHLAALKGQAELAIAEIMQNQTAMVILKSIFGGIAGAAYAFCDTITQNHYTMEELWHNVIWGAAFGILFGGLGGLIANRIILMFLGGFGILCGAGFAIDSFANGELRQGGFRTATTVLGAMAWWKHFKNVFKLIIKNIFVNSVYSTTPKRR